jgi:hypothetical protein
VRAGDNSGRSYGFSRCEGDEEGDKEIVPKMCGLKLMCVGRGLGPDEGGGVFGRGDIGRVKLVVVSVCVLVCMSGCVGFGSRWDTMAPILCENTEERNQKGIGRTLKACSPDLQNMTGSTTDTRAGITKGKEQVRR